MDQHTRRPRCATKILTMHQELMIICLMMDVEENSTLPVDSDGIWNVKLVETNLEKPIVSS